MKLKSIIYPLLSIVIAMIISAILIELTRIGFASVLTLEWGWGVVAIVVAAVVLMIVSGLSALPTLFFARRLRQGSVGRRLALNMPALIYFIGAVWCFVTIFSVDFSFGVSQWIEALLAAGAVLAFSLRVSFLPIIVITSNRQ